MSCQAKPIVAFESSCDETAVAVYQAGRGLLAHQMYSQIEMHAHYGGVVPELAARDHVAKLPGLYQSVMQAAGIAPSELGGVAYTAGPGLVGAVMVGASFARALAQGLGVPALAVNHLEGHILAVLLEDEPLAPFPWVTLLASGGHTQLIRVDGFGQYALLGESIDDAVGEAFDKAAMLLGFDYPGGAALAQLAEQGDPKAFRFARPMLGRDSLDFSFSGLKTAAAVAQVKQDLAPADFAAAYQAAIVDVLSAKLLRACAQVEPNMVVLAGGVAANQALRQAVHQGVDCQVRVPEPQFCTDNAAMIAVAGALRLADGQSDNDEGVRARWPLASIPAFSVEAQLLPG